MSLFDDINQSIRAHANNFQDFWHTLLPPHVVAYLKTHSADDLMEAMTAPEIVDHGELPAGPIQDTEITIPLVPDDSFVLPLGNGLHTELDNGEDHDD